MDADDPVARPSIVGSCNALVPQPRPGAFLFRRVGFALLLVAAAASGEAQPAPARPSAPVRPSASGHASRPDVLLVTLDTTRADQLGCYGAPGARTPTLDGLAAAGVRFRSAWSPAPLTLPAHTSLFTGLDPAEHGLRDNGWGALGPTIPVLAEELRRAGYATAGFPASRVLDGRFGLGRGFDLYDDRMAAERIGQYGYPERPAAEVVDAALAWLGSAPRDRPLFVWVHFYDPHAPYQPPASVGAGTSERERYAGEIAYVDRELGRLLQSWPAGRRRVVAAVGDHGEAFGEHGEHGHGLLLYRSTLEVPLLLSGDGVPRAAVIQSPVASRRLAATLAELTGIPSRLSGPPLSLRSEPRESLPIFHETLFPASAYGWSPLAAATQGEQRVIVAPNAQPPAIELYDLASDPAEAKSLGSPASGKSSQATSESRRLQRTLHERLEQHPLDVVAPEPPDAEVAAALRSLGYLSGQTARAGHLDPKDGLPLLTEFEATGDLLSRGAVAAALPRLRALVAQSPGSVPFLSRLATTELQAGDHKAALATLDKALALSPRLDFLHLSRAEALVAAGRPVEAAAAFRLVTELSPHFASAWMRLAEMELRAGHPAEEEKLLRQGIAAGATSAFLLVRLAQIELARGDLAAADGHLATATELLPEWPTGWRLWAQVAQRQGKADLAAAREKRAEEAEGPGSR